MRVLLPLTAALPRLLRPPYHAPPCLWAASRGPQFGALLAVRGMAGHNKWSQIKRAKGANDANRAKLWSKLHMEIAIVVKECNGDLGDSRVQTVMEKARSAALPKANIEKAVAHATGANAVKAEKVVVEGRGPAGVAVLVDCLTDSKGRTLIEIKKIMHRNGGTVSSPGSIAYMFHHKGLVLVKGQGDEVVEAAIEAGAEDVSELDEGMSEVTCAPLEVVKVKSALEAKGLPVDGFKTDFVPEHTVEVPEEGEEVTMLAQLVEALEDHGDVVGVYINTQ